MTNEEKQILLKNLCEMLPYHPIVKIYNDSWEGCKIGEFNNNLYYHHVEAFACGRIEIKPYLRPISSMTKEEKHILENLSNCYIQTKVLERDRKGKIKKEISYLDNEIEEMDLFGDNDNQYRHVNQKNFVDTLDFFNSRYLDYRGLIPMGLALKAPEDMYKIE